MSLTVDAQRRCPKTASDRWLWVVKMFSPRHTKCPSFSAALIYRSDGKEVPLEVSLLSAARSRYVSVGSRTEKPSGVSPSRFHRKGEMTLAFEAKKSWAERTLSPTSTEIANQETAIAAGTRAKVVLLEALTASTNRAGDSFQARIIEPVQAGGTVALPEGTLLEGQIAKVKRPRWLSRSGALLLTFNRVMLPGEAPGLVSASVAGAQMDADSRSRIDHEGGLHGGHPGKLWMLVNLGATSGMAKAVDDGTQLVIEALASTATDASTAGVARIAATCISGLFMITRHGRGVSLPKFTEMEIVFNRSVSLPAARHSSFLLVRKTAQEESGELRIHLR